MFFKKKSSLKEDAVTKKGIKKIDAIVTGAILSGIVGSIYGVKKIKDSKKQDSQEKEMGQMPKKSFLRRLFSRKHN